MKILSCVFLALVACSGGSDGKSVFALVASDFEEHTALQVGGGPAARRLPAPTGVGVDKGDVLYVEASGELTTGDLTSGPNGAVVLGGSGHLLPSRPVGALFGRIGEAEFLIGSGVALVAPASGELTVVANVCLACATTGGFAVTVHHTLAEGVEVAREPRLTDNSILESTALEVDAAAGWVRSGLTVARGQKVFVRATGTLTAGDVELDANGDGALGGSGFLLPNQKTHRLHARVGDRVVDVGVESTFLAPAAGVVELGINAAGSTTGTLEVSLGGGIVPAVGLESLDPVALSDRATVTVPATTGFQTTGIRVAKGEPVVFSATGSFTDGTTVGPFGFPGLLGGTGWLVPNGTPRAVYAKIGGQILYVGGSSVLLSPVTGIVEVAMNTVLDCGGDCAGEGAFEVTVSSP